MEHKKVYSYGIIPIFEDYDGYKVLVVQNTKGGHWGFPKGTPEPGESPLQTAVRELEEETGIEQQNIHIQPEPELTQVHLFEKDGKVYEKTNTYWIGFVKEPIIGNNLDEIIEARWVTPDEAKKLFSIPSLNDLTVQIEEYLESINERNW